MRVLTAAYILALGAGLGLGSAHLAVAGRPLLGKVSLGSWEAWPGSGGRDIDPYLRAHLARGVHLPLGTGEGLELIATRDDTGAPLTGRCNYRLTGSTPPARGWTLQVTDGAGRNLPPAIGRSGFSDAEIVRDESGALDIVAAASVQPGNWLPLPRGGDVQLRLRLYDTPLSSQVGEIVRESLPHIRRVSCP